MTKIQIGGLLFRIEDDKIIRDIVEFVSERCENIPEYGCPEIPEYGKSYEVNSREVKISFANGRFMLWAIKENGDCSHVIRSDSLDMTDGVKSLVIENKTGICNEVS